MSTLKTKHFPNPPEKSTVVWSCPSNIALIKYWGKCGKQIPCNPSISLTLSRAQTISSVSWQPDASGKAKISFKKSEKFPESFQLRIQHYFEMLAGSLPWVINYRWEIRTENTFPHSAGIASSASAFGAIALGICTAAIETGNKLPLDMDFETNASFLARLGSGSAARSVYGGWVLWGKSVGHPESADEYAVQIENVHSTFRTLQDAILIISGQPKAVTSSQGHARMERNPFAQERYKHANSRILPLIHALKNGDWNIFSHLVRQEALDLHGLMMISDPGYILMKPNTLSVIEEIEKKIRNTGLEMTWTLDAGPNVHLLYTQDHRKEVLSFIREKLVPLCEKGTWLDDEAGPGPVKRMEL